VPPPPQWYTELPEADRTGLLASLPVEELWRLPQVAQAMQAVRQQTALEVQGQTSQLQLQQRNEGLLQQGVANFVESLSDWAPAGVDLRAEADSLSELAQRAYHQQMTSNIEQGLLRGLSRVGLGPQNLPPSLLSAVNGARDYGEVVQAYVNTVADAAFNLGTVKARSDGSDTLKAETTAARARARNEALGELAKDGRIRIAQDADGYFAQLLDNNPPALSGTPAASGAVEIEEAEFNRVMSDPDYYDTFMKDPAKAAALHKLMTGEMEPSAQR